MRNYYTLSEVERRLIVAWNLCADISIREIAQRADIREHRVRRALENLVQNGIIVPTFLVDNYRLGFSDYGIFFAPSAESTAMRTRFEESLLAHPRIYWLAKMTGAFQYGTTFLARQPHEVVDFFACTQSQSKGAFPQRTVRIGVDCTWYSPNYLAPEISRRESVSISSREQVKEPSEMDRQILVAMTRNPAASTTHLARVTGMNTSSLAYRIDKLREEKIVRGRMYSIRTTQLGILMYRIMVVDCGLSASQREQFLSACAECPNVVAVVVCSGSWDFELRFEAEDPNALERFCQFLVDTFGRSIGSLLISQQLSTLKRIAYPDDQPALRKAS